MQSSGGMQSHERLLCFSDGDGVWKLPAHGCVSVLFTWPVGIEHAFRQVSSERQPCRSNRTFKQKLLAHADVYVACDVSREGDR